MQIVIDIDEEIYNFVQNTSFVEDESTLFKQTNAERQKTLFLFDIIDAIRNGTPLPEHHGRLIDADRLTRAEIMHLWYHLPNGDIVCPKIDIDHAPTIIEADRGE